MKNLRSSFPEKNNDEITKLKNEYYKTLVSYIFETILVYYRKKKYFENKIKFINPDILKTEKSNIILASHLGNWEWTSMLLPLYTSNNIVGLYKPLSNKNLEILVKQKRARFGLELLSINDATRYLAKSSEVKSYIFISDQSPANAHTGRWYKFLNQDTLFYEGAEVLSKRYGMNVFFQKVRLKNEQYEVSYHKLSSENITQQYVHLLENEIKLYPELWLWSHNRWKHQKNV
jgi:KDO2-lipid IV(A) lauroyltransferase